MLKYKNSTSTAFDLSLVSPYRYVIDDTIKYLMSLGVDPVLISGILGNMSQESRFNPNAVGPGGFKGTVLMSKDMAKEIKRVYGKVDYKTTNLFIHDAMSGNKNISSAWRVYMRENGGYYGRQFKNSSEAAMAFGKVFERPNEKHANWRQRQLSAEAAYKYILDNYKNNSDYDYVRAAELGYTPDNTGHYPSRDVETGDYLKKATHPTVLKSVVSDIAEGYNPTYNSNTGRLNSLTWMKSFELPKLQPAFNPETGTFEILTPQVLLLPRLKNGKLPGYKIGVIPENPTNATINQDGTFVDDYTRVFDDLIITPKGPRIKPGLLHKYQEPWDDEKFLNAVTVGGLNNLSPAQWARRGYDAINGNLTADSWLNGNAGIVPNKYAKEHPLGAMAANALFDFWTLGGPSLMKNARDLNFENWMRSYKNDNYYTSQPYYPEYKYSREHYDFLEWKKSHEEYMKSILDEKPDKPLIAKETLEPNIPTDVIEEGVVGTPTKRVVVLPVKKYDLHKISNDVAKDPYIDDATDAWISQMNRNSRDWEYKNARDIIDKNLPDLYEMEDIWVKNGMAGQKPRFYDYYEWKKIPEELRILLLFDEKIDPKYGTTYFTLKPEYRGIAELNGGLGNPYGISPRINIEDPKNTMYTSIPQDMRSKGPFVSGEDKLKQVFGEEPIPYSGKIKKPIHPRERLDWSDYRNLALEKINQDWNSNGPLSQHLKRSGISDPKILLDYILSPEQAWEVSIKNSGLDIGTHLFRMNLEDDITRNPTYLSGFETSLNKVLRRYGYDNIALDKSTIISAGGIRSQIQKHVVGNNNLNISTKQHEKINKIYNAAMNDVLKRDLNAAREFYNRMEELYDNAFANHRGGTYIPLKTDNYSDVVSHEFGHLEDNSSTLSKEITGVPESSQVTNAPSAKSALFKKAFNVEGDHKRYFAGYNDENATEMALRATQVKDFLKLKKGEEVTPEMLQYAIDNYVKDTGMDNNMTEFFNMIIDLEAAAKWITAHGKAMAPVGIGVTAYRKLNPRRKNK